MHAQNAVDFLALMRLSLNVASTRVVLMYGHEGGDAAGKVIESFGEVLIGGNYAVGLVVFAILMIINFVVVTKGAGRVSEVSARFTLDAMPGKQMAIDADLNAGLIDAEAAKIRRSDVAQEADFYGSMDGASKFVRGDAVAGILILVINIIGGLIIGIVQHDLVFADAVQKRSEEPRFYVAAWRSSRTGTTTRPWTRRCRRGCATSWRRSLTPSSAGTWTTRRASPS